MTHVHRAIVFYLFLLVFLISAPLLILYTSGYRYSFRTGRIARVGALVLKSVPREASITLNDHRLKEQTPASLELAEDEYQVVVSKDGSHTWTKLLSVKSQETAFAESIVLWRDADPVNLIDIMPLTTSMEGRISIAYDAVRGVTLYDRTSGVLTPITDLPVTESGVRATIDADGKLALVSFSDSRGRTQFVAINMLDGTTFDTDFLTPFAFSELVWGESTGTLYGVSGGRLRAANLFSERVDTLAQSSVPFLVHGTDVWSIADTGRVFLTQSEAGDVRRPPYPIAELPAGSYTILPAPHPYLLLHETEHNHILLINLENPTEIIAELTGDHAATRMMGHDDLELLVWNAFELWRVRAATGEQELLRRQSEPIREAAWHPYGGYVAIASGDHVEMLELDSRGERNSTLLANFPDHTVREFLIDPDGAFILITVEGGPQAGLYSLELQ